MNKNKQKNNINVGCKIENINNNIIRKICIYMKNILNINFLFFNKYLMIIHYLIISLIAESGKFLLTFLKNIAYLFSLSRLEIILIFSDVASLKT